MKDNNRIFDDYMRNRRPDVNDDRDVSRQTTVVADLLARIAELEKLAVVWEKCESREQIDHSRRYCVICDRGELWICYIPAPPEEK